jgi:hypothetical protein
MIDAVFIVIAVGAMVVAFLATGIWAVGGSERRARFDVAPARRPDAASSRRAANDNASQRDVRPGSPGSSP